jgi:putative DNA primase/helicase
MQTSRSKFDRALLPDGFSFYRAELGELGRADRKGWALAKSGCPFHQSASKRSFFVNRDGAFNCFNCGAKGGDVIAFLLLRDRVTFKSAAQQLGAWREDMTPAESNRLRQRQRDGERHRAEQTAEKERQRQERVSAAADVRAVDTLYREAIAEHDFNLMADLLPRVRQLEERYYTLAGLEVHHEW